MPFLASETCDVPETDITSWYYDSPQFPQTRKIYIDALNPSRYYTAADCRLTIRRLIAGFTIAGLRRGDCVCLLSFNDINYPVLANGIVGFGGVFAGANPSYTVHELVHHLQTAKAKMVFAEPELLSTAVAAAKVAGIPRDRVIILDHLAGAKVTEGFIDLKRWRWFLQWGEMDWERLNGKEARETTVARLFSSGTTGLPKAAVLSHYNIIAQHVFLNDWKPKSYEVRRLQTLPFFHVAAVPSVHFSGLRNGVQTYICRRFDLETFLASIERHQITDLPLVPPIAIAIIMSDLTKKYSLKSVKMVTSGAAPLDKGPQKRLQEILGSAPFTQLWGMTECTCTCFTLPWPEADDTGSVGRALPNLDLKLVDDDGADITDYNVRGELCVRGPTVVSGYFENPEANARDWDAQGYFHTGDIAYIDSESKLVYIVDRKKELIKVRGFQVAPPEIEAVLLSHPLIVDAAVIGVTLSRDDSELPRAYVVRRPGNEDAKTLAEADIKEFMKGKLARYKQLEGGVIFLNSIPKNPSGKILKRVLRDLAKAEVATKL